MAFERKYDDRLDSNVTEHVSYFLTNLSEGLCLPALLRTLQSDPAKVLEQIQATRHKIHEQRRIAKSLLELLQNSNSDSEACVPAVPEAAVLQ